MREFYWLRKRETGKLVIGGVVEERWYVFGGAPGWFPKEELEEDYEILEKIEEPEKWRG